MRIPPFPPVVGLILAGVLVLSGCQGSADSDKAENDSPAPSASTSATPTPTTKPATPARKPDAAACYQLSYDQAVAPTTRKAPVSCEQKHTAQTFAVGELDPVVDGHLLAVDSRYLTNQVAAQCPGKLADYLGGSPEDLRLSMLRPVWFSPTVEEAEKGENWYRCDVIALGGKQKLADLPKDLKGFLGTPAADKLAMCAPTGPNADGFERRPCGTTSNWRAISTVDISGDGYPGEQAAKDAGTSSCKETAQSKAEDPMKFTYAFEYPTRAQWDGGQRYGFCWVPQ